MTEIDRSNVVKIVEDNGGFAEYQKKGVTRISHLKVVPGTVVFTPERVTVDEPSRIALDAEGYPYPIREDIFRESFERVPDAGLATIAEITKSDDDLDKPYGWRIAGDLGQTICTSEGGWDNPDDANADLIAIIGRLTSGVIDIRDETD